MKKITEYSEDSVQTICIFSDHDLNTGIGGKLLEKWHTRYQLFEGVGRTELWKDGITNTISPPIFSKRWGTKMLASKLHKMVFLDLEGSYHKGIETEKMIWNREKLRST